MNPVVLSLGGGANAFILALFLFFLITLVGITLLMYLMIPDSYYKTLSNPELQKKLGLNNTSTAIPPKKQRYGQFILSILLLLYLGSYLAPPFFEFRKVIIFPDTTWKIRNAWNIPLGTIHPDTPRELQEWTVNTTFVRPYKTVSQKRLHIVTQKNTYRSVGNNTEEITKMKNTLETQAQTQNSLATFARKDFYTTLQYGRYTLLGLIVVVGVMFWRNKKK